ncbi:unnamed protein product [Enterobius vermicularis]|uniref:Pre-mRNA-splicing factor SYF2 n=1 Tax=Enterobius vermicularis TaxID=51028 RepID=A0A0N4VHD8_ENTVE|nr:unnamed protein product [Enterobius vermicularis]
MSGVDSQIGEASSSAGPSTSAPANSSSSSYMNRFKKLHAQRLESRKLNHESVVEEDRRLKLPQNYEVKRKRQEWELEELEARKKAEEAGEDYERLKALETQADIADRKEYIKRKKKNPDKGFSDYEAMTLRQYERLSGNIKPDMKSYEEMRQVVQKKREQYHRRRMFDPDAPIDYINERNRKFNQKLDRFYSKYTEDLKGDLERGTAI